MEELWTNTNIFYNVLCFFITENEKLFDRSDSNLYWRTVFHLFGLLHHMYVGLFAASLDIEHSLLPEIKILYTYRGAYLTGWNFVFQSVFLALSLAHDVLEWLDKNESTLCKKIKYYRDVIFCGLVIPSTLFVTSMFWVIYGIDRELVFPKIYDQVIPWWFNHCVHTNITIVVIVETLLQARRHPTDKKLELILYLAVALGYAVVYYTIYFAAGRWLYQVFGVLSWWQICLFQIGIWASMYFFYVIQFPINRLFHGPEESENHENQQKRSIDEPDGTKIDENGTRVSENGTKTNGTNDNGKIITDLKTPPFSTKSWSLKFRSIRSQFENSRL